MAQTKKKKEARHSANQLALDHLKSVSEQPRYLQSHYPRLFRKGMESLQKCPLPVTNRDEAMALSGFGNFLTTLLTKHLASNNNTTTENDPSLLQQDAPTARSTTSTTTQKRPPSKKRPRSASSSEGTTATAASSRPRASAAAAAATTSTTQTTISSFVGHVEASNDSTSSRSSLQSYSGKSKRLDLYHKSVREAEGVAANMGQYTDWHVVLLVDRREQKADDVVAQLRMKNVCAEIRTLPIGDMLWIARGSRRDGDDVVEVVLGTVIERKAIPDLVSSLFGTRFEEQRLRLKNSAAGVSRVIFLVEGSLSQDLQNCPASTLRTALMQTMIHLGFCIIKTQHLQDTIGFLKRIHQGLERQCFPILRTSSSSSSSSSSSMPPKYKDGFVRLFEAPPRNVAGTSRPTLYTEFQAKLELAREAGTKSVGAIHKAMLKQVPSMSQVKVCAIASQFPTPRHLMTAYAKVCHETNEEDAMTMVQDVRTNTGLRKLRIGPKTSQQLCHVYTAGSTQPNPYLRTNDDNNEQETETDIQPTPNIAANNGDPPSLFSSVQARAGRASTSVASTNGDIALSVAASASTSTSTTGNQSASNALYDITPRRTNSSAAPIFPNPAAEVVSQQQNSGSEDWYKPSTTSLDLTQGSSTSSSSSSSNEITSSPMVERPNFIDGTIRCLPMIHEEQPTKTMSDPSDNCCFDLTLDDSSSSSNDEESSPPRRQQISNHLTSSVGEPTSLRSQLTTRSVTMDSSSSSSNNSGEKGGSHPALPHLSTRTVPRLSHNHGDDKREESCSEEDSDQSLDVLEISPPKKMRYMPKQRSDADDDSPASFTSATSSPLHNRTGMTTSNKACSSASCRPSLDSEIEVIELD